MNKSLTQTGEIYFCKDCKKPCNYADVWQTWLCPGCKKNVRIGINIEGNLQDCVRVAPNELKAGDLVTSENKSCNAIIKINKEGDIYRVAIKKYRTINMSDEDCITKIEGAWSYN